jgi:hypothetical protein
MGGTAPLQPAVCGQNGICAPRKVSNDESACLSAATRTETAISGSSPRTRFSRPALRKRRRPAHSEARAPATTMQLGATRSDDATHPGVRAKSPWHCHPASARLVDLPAYPFPTNRESGPDDGIWRNPEADAKGDVH